MSRISISAMDVQFGTNVMTKTGSRENLMTILERIGKDQQLKKIMRSIRNKTDHDEKSKCKRQKLPYFVLGTFNDNKRKKGCLEKGWGMVLDLDGLDDRLPAVRKAIKDDPYMAFLFTSPSGNGLKVGVMFEKPVATNDEYKRVWDQVTAYFRERYDVENDQQTSDSSRATYLSYDPDIVIREDVVGFPLPKQDKSENETASMNADSSASSTRILPRGTDEQRETQPDADTFQQAMSAAAHLKLELGDQGDWEYHDWRRMGFAIYNTFGEDGLPVWLTLSLDAKGYHDSEDSLIDQYTRIARAVEEGDDERESNSIGSLFRLAMERGWRFEATGSSSGATDVAIARQVSAFLDNHFRYNVDTQTWLFWNGQSWEEDRTCELRRQLTAYADSMQVDDQVEDEEEDKIESRIVRKLLNNGSAKSIMTELSRLKQHVVRQAELDSHHELLNVNNGVIDVRTGEFRGHRKSDLFTHIVDVDYDPDAKIDWFQTFLDDVLVDESGQPDAHLQRFIQQAIGYSLTGNVDHHCFFFLYGEGANGKSTLLNIIHRLVSQYTVKLPAELITMYGNPGNPGHHIATLPGKRLALCGEVPANSRLNEALIKDLTGGDPLQANPKYVRLYTFQPTHKVWIAGNHKPRVEGNDHGIWRRIKLVPFRATIPAEKMLPPSEVTRMVEAELPGILNWAMEGYRDLLEHGFDMTSITPVVLEYQRDNDVIGAFLEESVVERPGAELSARNLYQKYSIWCEDRGYRPWKMRLFTNDLKRRGYIYSKVNREGKTYTRNQGHWWDIDVPIE